jgi:hypothetical protein
MIPALSPGSPVKSGKCNVLDTPNGATRYEYPSRYR